MKLFLVVTAAGSSRRMGGGNKLLLSLAGQSVLAHTLSRLSEHPELAGLVVTAPSGDEEVYRELVDRAGFRCTTRVVTGADERQLSITQALEALSDAAPGDAVAIHDGARPNVSAELLTRLVAGLERWSGVLPMVAVKDTIKRVASDGRVLETLERRELFAAQTPQLFRYGVILQAHRRARAEGRLATDDAALVEWVGESVGMVEGDYGNLKVTTPEDLPLLEKLLADRPAKSLR